MVTKGKSKESKKQDKKSKKKKQGSKQTPEPKPDMAGEVGNEAKKLVEEMMGEIEATMEGEEEDKDMPEGEGDMPDEEMPDMSDLLPPTDVYMLSQLFVSMLGNSAWQHLGLIPDPKTQTIVKDLKQAGLAIDIMSFIFEKTKDDLEKDMAHGVQDLLTNLRVNYMTKLSEDSK